MPPDPSPPELAALFGRYNATPQADLLGLSPDQVASLLVGDWRTTGGVRLEQRLDPEQVSRGWAFPAALAFLRLVLERGVAPVTTGGNLTRKFVALALDALDFPAGYVEETRAYNKVIDEPDAWLLFRLRETLVGAGWLHRRSGFRVSGAGRAALESAETGRLFTRLFLAAMGVPARWLDVEGVVFQSPLGPALYLLHREARDWIAQLMLDERLLIPSLFPELTPIQLSFQAYQWVVAPCLAFGLVEERSGPKSLDPRTIRTTKLFSEFVSFRFPNERHPSRQAAMN